MLPANTNIRVYFSATILSIVFAVVGFSYNAWRLERSEANTTIRTASFEVLTQLADLEQTLYIAFYDNNAVQGSPRKAWVKVGLIADLSVLISPEVESQSQELKRYWAENWQGASDQQIVVDQLISHIDGVRSQIKITLATLE